MLNITKSLEIMDALLNTKAKPTNVVSFPVNPYLALFTTLSDVDGITFKLTAKETNSTPGSLNIFSVI